MRLLSVLLAWLPLVSVQGAACLSVPIQPGGGVADMRVLHAPPARVREVVADAMRAADLNLVKNAEWSLQAENKEALFVTLQTGPEGRTEVRAETRRLDRKGRPPDRSWSVPVLAHAECLLTALSLDDPAKRPREPGGGVPDPPAGATVPVRLRRFYSSIDSHPERHLVFEVAEDVTAGGSAAIPRGTLVLGRMAISRDESSFGRGARGTLMLEAIVTGGGARIPLEAEAALQGQDRKGDAWALGILIAPWAAAATSGKEIRLPAGTLFMAKIAPKR